MAIAILKLVSVSSLQLVTLLLHNDELKNEKFNMELVDVMGVAVFGVDVEVCGTTLALMTLWA